jgi:hypothetical protein
MHVQALKFVTWCAVGPDDTQGAGVEQPTPEAGASPPALKGGAEGNPEGPKAGAGGGRESCHDTGAGHPRAWPLNCLFSLELECVFLFRLYLSTVCECCM